MDENRNLPVHAPATDVTPTDKPTPSAHCATLTEVFTAVGAYVGYRLSAGARLMVPDAWGLSTQDVTVETDSWLFGEGEIISIKQFTELAEAGELKIIQPDTVRKLTRPGGEIRPIRKGETYRTNTGNEEKAPRNGYLFFVSKEELVGTGIQPDDEPADIGLFGGLASMASSMLGEIVDGDIFLSEELYQLYFGEGVPEGIILVQHGETFQAAALPADITLASANKGDLPVKAGSIVRGDEDDPDRAVIVPAPMFVMQFAPLA